MLAVFLLTGQHHVSCRKPTTVSGWNDKLLLKRMHSETLASAPQPQKLTRLSASIRATQGKGQEVAYLFQSRFQEYQSET